MIRSLPVFAVVVAAVCLSSTTGAVPAANDRPPAGGTPGIQAVTFQPPPAIRERIAGLRVVLTQISYPGVPERAACRFLVRAINEGQQRIGTHALLRTYDTLDASLNTWLVPTGELAPGQAVERIYSCKQAQSLLLDQRTASGWPGRCLVDGEERSPCPLTLVVETNLRLLKEEPAAPAAQPK